MARSTVVKGSLLVAAGVVAAGVTATIWGPSGTEGLKRVVMEETLSPSAVETPLSNVVPKGSVVRGVFANAQAALTGGGTTVTWSVGNAGDPDKYGTAGFPTQADSLAKNSKSNWLPSSRDWLAANETIVLTGTATGGAADGNTALTVGSVRIVVVYDTFAALADAP
jgi:hypothetical protein